MWLALKNHCSVLRRRSFVASSTSEVKNEDSIFVNPTVKMGVWLSPFGSFVTSRKSRAAIRTQGSGLKNKTKASLKPSTSSLHMQNRSEQSAQSVPEPKSSKQRQSKESQSSPLPDRQGPSGLSPGFGFETALSAVHNSILETSDTKNL